MPFPKGIRTRSTPDWYARYLSIGGFGVGNSAARDFKAVSLYNNSVDGAYLFIYGLGALADIAQFSLMLFQVGTPPGTLQSQCARVNPSRPAPPGQIYFAESLVALGLSGGIPVDNFMNILPRVEGPQFIVPAGYSLINWSDVPNNAFAGVFWYVPFLDPDGRRPT